MKTIQITFSPTGGTAAASRPIASGMGLETASCELCVPAADVQIPVINPADIAIIAVPVYSGRVPAMAAERIRKISANGALCVAVSVYGNRAYEDALLELCDIAANAGFSVIAAVAANAEHSICRQFGSGRPDNDDARQLASFGKSIMDEVAKGAPYSAPQVPGNRPYRQSGKGPYPTAGDNCTGCGTCATKCPAGAIPAADPKGNDNSLCIGCMKCVSVCPTEARGIGQLLDALSARLEPLCRERKNNELFI